MNASLPTPALSGSGSGYHLSHFAVNGICLSDKLTFQAPPEEYFHELNSTSFVDSASLFSGKGTQ